MAKSKPERQYTSKMTVERWAGLLKLKAKRSMGGKEPRIRDLIEEAVDGLLKKERVGKR